MAIALGLLLILLGVFALALQRLYSCVPRYELKRLAARGDYLASILYRPVSYGTSFRFLLWIIFVGALGAGFLLAAYSLSLLFSSLLVILALSSVVWLLSVRLTVRSVRLAVWTAPVLHAIIQRLHRPLDIIARTANRYRAPLFHSGLYEKEDIVKLLRQQSEQSDNRVPAHVLEAIEHAVGLDETKASDIVQSWSDVKQVGADESIGPVLLGELHNSGQKMFAVYDGQPGNVVGALSLHDAVTAKSGGKVRSLMKPNICYAHEDFNLKQVLDAFATSGHSMLVVVNEFEETVGVITLRRVLEKLIGRESDDLAFEDSKTAAAWRPKPEPQFAEVPVADEVPSSDPTEVVE